MLSILTIDDEWAICELMHDYLKKKGYRIRTSQSGQEALRLIDDERPDIVFLDLMMPDMTGEDILKKVKKRYPDLPVIVLTGLGCEKKAIELLSQGAFDVITKPINFCRIEQYLSFWAKLSHEDRTAKHPLT